MVSGYLNNIIRCKNILSPDTNKQNYLIVTEKGF